MPPVSRPAHVSRLASHVRAPVPASPAAGPARGQDGASCSSCQNRRIEQKRNHPDIDDAVFVLLRRLEPGDDYDLPEEIAAPHERGDSDIFLS